MFGLRSCNTELQQGCQIYEIDSNTSFDKTFVNMVQNYDPGAQIERSHNFTTTIYSELLGIDMTLEPAGLFKKTYAFLPDSEGSDYFKDKFYNNIWGLKLEFSCSENDLRKEFLADMQQTCHDVGTAKNSFDRKKSVTNYISAHQYLFPLYIYQSYEVMSEFLYDNDLLTISCLVAPFLEFWLFDCILNHNHVKDGIYLNYINDKEMRSKFESAYKDQYDIPLKDYFSIFFGEIKNKGVAVKNTFLDISAGTFSILRNRDL
ncbi:MAG: hypothetical protein KAS90_04205 [Candidatus Aenigmarchaeota archaeon]|nr:hypothetical protein [Candidatus Aenigmarchaeota archaeon]